MCSPVGASLLAMIVNDNACGLVQRGVLETIASKLAPTGLRSRDFSELREVFFHFFNDACH
jgi:hypothetical protein